MAVPPFLSLAVSMFHRVFSPSCLYSTMRMFHGVYISTMSLFYRVYWAVQAGLLTPLTFARHHLSPLAAFTSGAYFLLNGRG